MSTTEDRQQRERDREELRQLLLSLDFLHGFIPHNAQHSKEYSAEYFISTPFGLVVDIYKRDVQVSRTWMSRDEPKLDFRRGSFSDATHFIVSHILGGDYD